MVNRSPWIKISRWYKAVPKSHVRQFATLGLLFCGGICLWKWLNNKTYYLAIVWGLSGLLVGSLGLIFPRLLKPVYFGAMLLAFPVGWVVSHLLLAILFFGLITPMALVFRWIGREVISKWGDGCRGSYWTVKAEVSDPKRYLRQY